MINDQYYTNSHFNRAISLRKQKSDIGVLSNTAVKQVIIIWRDKIFFKSGQSYTALMTEVPTGLMVLSSQVFFLGKLKEKQIACIDISILELPDIMDLLCEGSFLDLRKVIHRIHKSEAALLAFAKGLTAWNRDNKYCGVCGSKTKSLQLGHSRICTGSHCSQVHYPRIDPGIIVLIETNPTDKPRQCLLNLDKGKNGLIGSAHAGHVEIGETLEDAVKREMKAEVNIEVTNIRYVSSQPWPFPSSIMIAFKAESRTKDFTVNNKEISNSAWFTANEINDLVTAEKLMLSQRDFIARSLIESWVKDNMEF